MFLKKAVLILLLIQGILAAQAVNNLEVISGLIDKSAGDITGEIKTSYPSAKDAEIDYNSAEDYVVLKNRVVKAFTEKGLTAGSDNPGIKLDYTIEETGVEYTDMFRSWFFGTYMLERNVFLKGSYSYTVEGKPGKTDTFFYAVADTVKLDRKEELENSSLPFTGGKEPEEPFLSTIWEPFIAVTATIITIYLFFNVRSK